MTEDDPTAKLSNRQRACLMLVADLKKTEQIAAELGISPSIVNTHIERAVAILGVPNRREAARLVVAHASSRPEKSTTESLRLPIPSEVDADPVPTRTSGIGRVRNDLSWERRLGLALLALFPLCIGLAGLGASIEQLSHWRSSLAARRINDR